MLNEGFRTKPKFLLEEDLLAFKRDTCIFCNSKFKGEDVEKKRIYRSRGDHYGGDIEEEYFEIIYFLDEEIYYFKFDDIDKKLGLEFMQEEIRYVEKMKKQRQEEAEKLREELNQNLNLQGKQRERAINAIVNDYLSEIRCPTDMFSPKYSPLELKIKGIFHNLQLGDLSLICKKEAYHIKREGKDRYKHTHLIGNPDAYLKSHITCWPFKSPVDNIKNSDLKLDVPSYSFEVETEVKNFMESLQKNSIFSNYSELFKDKSLKEIWDYILNLDITIKAKNYNPKSQ